LSTLQLDIHPSIDEIDQAHWDEWFGTDYPFLRWQFLSGLEAAACTGDQTGWRPFHLVLKECGETTDTVIAVAPAFLKSHSYGEYVFDWAWADAWQRTGRDYYPKLTTAAPFTPATGTRLYLNGNADQPLAKLISAVQGLCEKQGISGWHILFDSESLSNQLSDHHFVQRRTCQFHWFNRGYQSFDDFLGTFSSRKRKNLRKERQQVLDQGLTIDTLEGSAITPDLWSFFHHCYQVTYAKRSGHGGYLTRAFFTESCPTLDAHTVMVVARVQDKPVAAALYFRSKDTLYGRYWGCLQEYDFLHFEACYYRGIEYCIDKGIATFDPGAQGEHKIQRGFEPTLTYSNHWVAEPGFQEAIADFCREECSHVQQYQAQARQLLPFKDSGGS